ncbi:MAG: fructose-2,6-bisphosphatase [Verrucomicrobiaceae bacterium]|nr:fructose-2,6-bisphosphatase [Verrucomicrobiaceae bacterium]
MNKQRVLPADVQMTTIDLLRHGECEGGEIFRGSTDVPLIEAGWEQMRQSLQPHSGWDCVVSSSLQRCRLFAEQFSTQHELPLSVNANFAEIHFGDWEGQKITDVEREHGASLWRFWNDPERFSPPNGETMHVFRDRVLAAIKEVLVEHGGKHILLISHGAVIRALLCDWLQMPLTAFSTIAVPYAGLSRIRIYRRGDEKPWIQFVFHRGE